MNFISTGVTGIKHVVAGNDKRAEDYVASSLRRIFRIPQDWQVMMNDFYSSFHVIDISCACACAYVIEMIFVVCCSRSCVLGWGDVEQQCRDVDWWNEPCSYNLNITPVLLLCLSPVAFCCSSEWPRSVSQLGSSTWKRLRTFLNHIREETGQLTWSLFYNDGTLLDYTRST